jgi:putative ABC transport system permease protein
MLRNYIKIAFRNIIRHKGYSFINIAGLAVGMAACILILLWVRHELSYDRFHENAESIYRVVENQYYSGNQLFPVAVTPAPLAQALKEEFPEIVSSTRLLYTTVSVAYGERVFNEGTLIFADPSFLEMFTVPFLRGNPDTALAEPDSVVLSKTMAEKYFGDEDAIGKVLAIRGETDCTVTGVIEDMPDNSHLAFDFILPYKLRDRFLSDFYRGLLSGWDSNSLYTYVKLTQGTPHKAVSRKIKDVIKAHESGATSDIYLQPLTRIHLYSGSRFAADIAGHGDILYVRLFVIIALFVVLIACINFMNLTTARSGNRSKEVGMRKVVGAKRAQIIGQFMGESVLLSFIALMVSMILVELAMPAFNALCGKQLALSFSRDVFVLIGLAGIAMAAGIISGSYPALLLSSFEIVSAVKGTSASGRRSAIPRKALVVIQFAVSIIIIIGTAIVYNQLDYIQNKKLGLDKESIIYTPLSENLRQKYETVKGELLRNRRITSVSATGQLPTSIMNSTSSVDWKGKIPEDEILFHYVSVDADYAHLFKMEMAEGRFFSKQPIGTPYVVINEQAVEAMGIESPVGKAMTLMGGNATIIGVVKDFHFKSVRAKIEPLVLSYTPNIFNYMLVRIQPDDIPDTIAYLKGVHGTLNPGEPFEFHFLDDAYDKLYRAEQRMGNIFGYFSFLAIFISCLGLFGMASFMAEKKTKEIGIRKAVGASVSSIVVLFIKEFSGLVIIANIIAWPLAYCAMDRWLQNYAYRISIGWEIFIISGISAFTIAMLSVSYQAVRAATASPVDALMHE